MGFSPKFIHGIIQACKKDYDISRVKEGIRIDVSLKNKILLNEGSKHLIGLNTPL